MVPFHFDYPEKLVLKIKDEIHNGHENGFYNHEILRVPEAYCRSEIDEKMSHEIGELSDSRGSEVRRAWYFPSKELQRTRQSTRSKSRLGKNPSVNKVDIEFLETNRPVINWEEASLL